MSTDDPKPKSAKHLARYYDISRAPLSAGDLITIYDEPTETKTTLKVEQAVESADATGRLLTVTILETNAENAQAGVTFDMELPYGVPTWGTVIKRADIHSMHMDTTQVLDLYAIELFKWLNSQPGKDYRRRFKDCVDFMVVSGYFPRDTFAANSERLKAVIRKRPRLLTSKRGGWVESSGVDLNAEMMMGMAGKVGVGAPSVRRVKITKLVAGVRLILESGLFGEIIVEE